MELTVQRKLAASVFRCSPKRVWFDPEQLSTIKESVTKQDMTTLINSGVVRIRPMRGVSRGRARERQIQRSKGLRRGKGSRKGKKGARLNQKEAWISRIRVQRQFLAELRDKAVIAPAVYQQLYIKSKGGFFRSKRHIKIYMEEKELFPNKVQAQVVRKKSEPTKKGR
ncbi:50S ribosomal protein L19e [Candidatus Woesearchaeota archaeon]|nr:50S ribosomal protein L19e [Candidatus Woesearchaeota archaeon]